MSKALGDEVKSGEGSPAESDLLRDPFIKRVIREDPLFRFLYNWRRPLLWVLVVVLCTGYLGYYLRQSREEGLQRAADLYAEVREEFKSGVDLREQLRTLRQEVADLKPDQVDKKKETEEKVKGLEEELEKLNSRLEGKLAALGDQKKPYDRIGAAYRILMAVERGDHSKLEREVSALQPESILAEKTEPDLFAELSMLLASRALLDRDESREQGRAILKELADKGRFSRVSAALTLAQVAVSDSDRAQALTLLEAIQGSEPTQGSLVEDEIQRLKS